MILIKITILEQSLEILAIVLPSGTIDLMKMNGQIKEQAEAPFLLHKHKSATLNAATTTLSARRHRRRRNAATAAFVSWNGFSLRLGRGGILSSGAVADYSQLRRQNMLGARQQKTARRAWRRRQYRLVRRGGQKKLGRGGGISLRRRRRHDGTCPFPSELLKFEHEPPSSLFSCTRENQWADKTTAERAHASNS